MLKYTIIFAVIAVITQVFGVSSVISNLNEILLIGFLATIATLKIMDIYRKKPSSYIRTAASYTRPKNSDLILTM